MATRSLIVGLAIVLAAALSMSQAVAAPTGWARAHHAAPGRSAIKKAHATSHAGHHHAAKHATPAVIDHSGQSQYGKASYYHGGRGSKKVPAQGMDTAASKTLPLGTRARVTNLANGKTAEVMITDRGPYVRHRIIDVTPHVADRLGLKASGVAPVEVKPLSVPQEASAKVP
jgi:rare lipoprotein A